jgi:hypothetical protein
MQHTSKVNEPTITLVAIDGGPVAIWERDNPVVPPFDPSEESDPSTWPEWTDNWHWEASRPATGYEDRPWDLELEPDAPDGNPHLHFAGIASLAERRSPPPVAGGSPEAEPYELDARRDAEDFYRRHPLSEFNRERTD